MTLGYYFSSDVGFIPVLEQANNNFYTKTLACIYYKHEIEQLHPVHTRLITSHAFTVRIYHGNSRKAFTVYFTAGVL